MNWKLRISSARQPRAAGSGMLAIILALALVTVPAALAQESEPEGLTNDVVSAEVLARLTEMIQSAESAQLEDLLGPESTNGFPQPGGAAPRENRFEKSSRPESSPRVEGSNRVQSPSRSPGSDRRSRNRSSSRSKSSPSGSSNSASDTARAGERTSPAASPASGSGPASLDYAAFKLIADRNIFDPNRAPRRGSFTIRPAPKQVDSLTLVGTMSYDRGTFAFFDGTSSEYKKALKLTDGIAGYRLTNIAPDSVKLAAGTNELELRVGMQLRREENGPWMLASRSGSYTAVSTAPSTNTAAAAAPTGTAAAPSAAESEIIERLRQRRAQE